MRVLLLAAALSTLGWLTPVMGQTPNELVSLLQKSLDRAGQREVSGPGSIIRTVLDALAQKKNNRVQGQLTIILGNFTYANSGLGGPFSRYLEDQVSAAVVGSRYFNLFPREVLSNLPAGLQDAFQSRWGDEIQGSLVGKYFRNQQGQLVLEYQLADLKQGKVILADSIVIPPSAIPAKMELEPLPGPVPPAVLPSTAGGLTLAVLSNRGSAGTYFENEEMVLTIHASLDCWLKIYQINGQGDLTLIYPNPFSNEGRIPGGTLVSIPGQGSNFAFKLGPPYGVETIRVMASTTPFQTQENAFESLGTNAQQVLSRGMTVTSQTSATMTAQAQIQYTVNPVR